MNATSQLSLEEHEFIIKILQDLVRYNTTNPPGNEKACCDYLARILSAHHIPCHILESAPNRTSLVARLKGDGTQPPLLLTSHLDVVPANSDNWEVPPFSGEIRDGYLWGRGTVDMKNMTAMSLAVILKCAREKIPLKRDIIFAAIADEECGSEHGAKFLVEKHPELIRAEYALNEVGGFSLAVEGKTFYPVGVAEKGVCWFTITAKGKSGHGAMPHDEQALPHVCLAAHRLATQDLPLHRTRVVSAFISGLANRLGFPKSVVLRMVQSKFLGKFILKNLIPDKSRARNFHNMLHNLATPTMATAGTKVNVIPDKACIEVDGRILPQSTVANFLVEIQNLIGDDFEITVNHSAEAVEQKYPTPLYDLCCRKLCEHDPEAIPVPFLIPGFTDAKQYARLGITCYGFVPLKLPPDLNFGALYHGINERIPLAALKFGGDVLWDVVKSFCG